LGDHREAPPPPYLGVLSPHGTTILYGDGGDGKGTVAARLIVKLVEQGIKPAIIDFEMQPQEWGFRLAQFGIDPDLVPYFAPPTTMDRWATTDTAQLLKSEGVGYLVIDSAMYASDSEDPYAPNSALAYGRARKRLNNLPTLLLAHITGGADKVFGSVFWKNECRISWRLNKEHDLRRHLVCKKANGYPWLEGRKLYVEYDAEGGVLELHEHGKPWGEGYAA